ncbi:Zn-ribbon domain-containing OB-fold protein [Bacillus sp. JJ722]|uniref:Zn-ribbon domain-containing OB-fold protein n=1 Tax=Bacillus sp. JJ722 TaxID=3122973 RepID=UPI0030009C14
MDSEHKRAAPFHQNLWKSDDGYFYLIGSKCDNCEEIFFPKIERSLCPQCNEGDLISINLSNEGIIHAYTVVNQSQVDGAVPYAYGIVYLPEGVNVYTLFVNCAIGQLRLGQSARLVVEKSNDQEGNEVFTYKFAPII